MNIRPFRPEQEHNLLDRESQQEQNSLLLVSDLVNSDSTLSITIHFT